MCKVKHTYLQVQTHAKSHQHSPVYISHRPKSLSFPSLLRITEPHAFFGHISHTPPALALRSQHTSTFLISPTSRPQTENFSTEPSANSSFPSGRSSHSLSVCTFWGPMMMMKTRLSVLESYSVPVVMVMWYGITATKRGFAHQKTHTHMHLHQTWENQGLIPSEGAAVHAKWVHIPLNSFGEAITPCFVGLRVCFGDCFPTACLGLNSARVNFPRRPYWLQGGCKSRFLPNAWQNSKRLESLLIPRDLPEDESENLNLKQTIRPKWSYTPRSIKTNKSVTTPRQAITDWKSQNNHKCSPLCLIQGLLWSMGQLRVSASLYKPRQKRTILVWKVSHSIILCIA